MTIVKKILGLIILFYAWMILLLGYLFFWVPLLGPMMIGAGKASVAGGNALMSSSRKDQVERNLTNR